MGRKKVEGLTKRQRQVLGLIRSHIERIGYPPSVREVGEEMGLASSATVHNHILTLEKKGYIYREGVKSRTIRLSEKGLKETASESGNSADNVIDLNFTGDIKRSVVELPLLGTIAAGTPILAEQNIEENLFLPKDIVGDSSSFMLKVHGDSMVDAGILDGDYVVVREQNTAYNGQIVAALIDDEATVKLFYREKDHIRLQPCNESMEPIYVEDATIMGVVVALFRTIR